MNVKIQFVSKPQSTIFIHPSPDTLSLHLLCDKVRHEPEHRVLPQHNPYTVASPGDNVNNHSVPIVPDIVSNHYPSAPPPSYLSAMQPLDKV
eukprot:CFRG5269T1